ncbi:hypothetical protein [Azonexus sp. IMCC34839]|uniref:hypothetical protein n=1 Tax=Azonexus sp. IMCC34839 TaxID=3133695 RepID=UPI00399A0758
MLVIVLHVLILWAAPFTSRYPTAPSIWVLVAFLAIFLLCAKGMIGLSARKPKGIPALPVMQDQVFGDRRLRAFLLLASLAGIALHVWSKYYLTEVRSISCFSEIRFVWLEVDRSLLPFHIRLASILGHLLTSFAYLGMLSTSYTMSRAGSVWEVSRSDIALQLFFTLVGALYAGFIGSRNAMLAFLAMNLIGLVASLGSSTAGEKAARRWRVALVVLAMPIVGMVAFSSAVFSDRIFCSKPGVLVKLKENDLSAGKIAANYMTGYYHEFVLQARPMDDGGAWREKLFVEMCPVCGPTMVYLNHGIFNLSRALAGEERGDPILLNFIAEWGRRIGLDVGMERKTGARVYGPGGITLAGAALHDYGGFGLTLTAAVLGMLFGKSICWMQSTGVRVLVGVWLFSCLFYVLFLSNMFVGFSVLPFPFIAFGIGAGLLVWMFMSRVPLGRHRDSARPLHFS